MAYGNKQVRIELRESLKTGRFAIAMVTDAHAERVGPHEYASERAALDALDAVLGKLLAEDE